MSQQESPSSFNHYSYWKTPISNDIWLIDDEDENKITKRKQQLNANATLNNNKNDKINDLVNNYYEQKLKQTYLIPSEITIAKNKLKSINSGDHNNENEDNEISKFFLWDNQAATTPNGENKLIPSSKELLDGLDGTTKQEFLVDQNLLKTQNEHTVNNLSSNNLITSTRFLHMATTPVSNSNKKCASGPNGIIQCTTTDELLLDLNEAIIHTPSPFTMTPQTPTVPVIPPQIDEESSGQLMPTLDLNINQLISQQNAQSPNSESVVSRIKNWIGIKKSSKTTNGDQQQTPKILDTKSSTSTPPPTLQTQISVKSNEFLIPTNDIANNLSCSPQTNSTSSMKLLNNYLKVKRPTHVPTQLEYNSAQVFQGALLEDWLLQSFDEYLLSITSTSNSNNGANVPVVGSGSSTSGNGSTGSGGMSSCSVTSIANSTGSTELDINQQPSCPAVPPQTIQTPTQNLNEYDLKKQEIHFIILQILTNLLACGVLEYANGFENAINKYFKVKYHFKS